MERKIGETFEYKGRVYKTIQSLSDSCINCAFVNEPFYACVFNKIAGGCSMTVREDKKNIIFKEIKKDMEIKDNKLTINIPDGMEIDVENCDFNAGVIKFKKKQPEFKDGDILYAEKDESHTDAIFILETVKGKNRALCLSNSSSLYGVQV